MNLQVTVDNAIRFALTPEVKASCPELMVRLRKDLVIDNPEYVRAKQKGRSTYHMPAKLTFYEFNPQSLNMALPRGYLHRFTVHLQDCNVGAAFTNRMPMGQRVQFHSVIRLRDYQVPAVEAALEAGSGVIEAPCGAGKTQMGLELVARHGQNAVWLTHTLDLAHQVIDRASECLGLQGDQIGLYGNGKRQIGTHLTVALIPTLAQPGCEFPFESFGLVLLDECFPAGTLVDGRPIETLSIGDSVTAWDEDSKSLQTGFVSEVFRRRPRALVRVKAGARSVVCTPTHPFWTRNGWVIAEDLREGDELLHVQTNALPEMRETQNCLVSETVPRVPPGGAEEAAGHSDELRPVWYPGDADQQATEGPVSGIQTGVLLPGAHEGILSAPKFGYDGQDKQEVRLKAHERTESHVQPGDSSQGESNKIGTGQLEASGSGRQWPGNATSAGDAGRGAGMASRVRGLHEDAEGQRISIPLQAGHCGPGAHDFDRSGRGESQLPDPADARREERRILSWTRVDSVEVLQPGSDGTFGGLCPDGAVYNIEVKQFHTYLAEGFVVHNCHHSPASTWAPLIAKFPAIHRYGVTATLERADGLEVATHLYVGPSVYRVPAEAVKDAGGTITPRLSVQKTETRSASWDAHLEACRRAKEAKKPEPEFRNYGGLLTELLGNAERNDLIIRTLAVDGPGHYSLVLSDRVAHCQLLCDLLRKKASGLKAAVIHGGLNKAERGQILDDMRAGKLRVLFAVDIAKEGLDLPLLDRLYLVSGGRNEAELVQKVGRVMRPAPGKQDAIVVDYLDAEISILKAQYYARRKVYKQLGIIA